MKQKDIALIIVIAFIAAVASFIISNFFFSSEEDRRTEVEVVEAISPEFGSPDERYFNNDSINPTEDIEIGGDDSNQTPF